MDYRVVSVDDHLVEPADVFTKRVPARLRDKVPHIRNIDGTPKWFVEDKMIAGVSSAAGVHWRDVTKPGVSDTYENMRRGGWDPKARLAEMDVDGVDASTVFPNFARFHGDPLESVPDLNIRLECIRAYNDWVVEDFCAADPKRLIAQTLVPPWDMEIAVAEAARSVKKGARALILGMAPDLFGYAPLWSHQWDPVWAAAQDMDVPVTFHQMSAAFDRAVFQKGKGILGGTGNTLKSHQDAVIPENIRAAATVAHVTTHTAPLAEFLMSGILERFPRMRVILAESGVSWIPYVLHQCDYVGERQQYKAAASWELKMPPSEYWKRQCGAGFWSDFIHPDLLGFMGEDTVMWEGDYPHPIVTWPNSQRIIEQSLSTVKDPRQRGKVLAGNAVRILKLS